MRGKAVVLSGGGNGGAAWMVGIVSGLQAHGTDLGGADLIVGTSAGARVGAQLATGALGQAVSLYRSGIPPVELYATLPQWAAAAMSIIAQAADQQDAARAVAQMAPVGQQLASGPDRRRQVAAQLPVHQWPQQRLLIVAVDADSGQRVVFDASSGVNLVDAVTASGALPGLYPLVVIGDRRYADGGAYSLCSADLASGHDVVIVISPVALNDYLRARLDREIAALGDARVHVVTADELSLAAIGPNAASVETMPAALDAGLAQAGQEINALAAIWHR